MSNQPSSSRAAINVPPVKKNVKGKLVCLRQKATIINVYKSLQSEQPEMRYKELIQRVGSITGVGRNTICKTISDYKNEGVLKSPNKTKMRATVCDKVNIFDKNAMRRKIHSIWFQNQIPTIDKILASINDDPELPNFSRATLHRLLKHLNFVCSKRNRHRAMIETDEIVIWRNKYLEKVKKYRTEGRTIYYLNETWINAGDSFLKGYSTSAAANPSGAGKRLIVLDIGSEEGFVKGGLLSFKSEKSTTDYHEEINGNTFFDWMKVVVPLLNENCVIVMDNSPNHCVKVEECPTLDWKKADIEKWLEEKGENFEKLLIKVRLMEIVKRVKPKYDKYVIDEFVKKHNRVVLRLPPYHCELNPIGLVWSVVKNHVKNYNTTFKIEDLHKLIHDGVNRCTGEIWKSCIQRTIEEEDKLWEIDFVVEEVMENIDSTKVTIKGEILSDSDIDF